MEGITVWGLVDSDRESLTKLVNSTRRKRALRRVLRWGDRMYLKALFLAEWDRIRSPVVLRVLAPMVEKMLTALGRYFKGCLNLECPHPVDRAAVKGALSLMRGSATRMVHRVATEISHVAQTWGNRQAWTWPYDPGFLRYLVMMSLPQNNNPYMPFTIRL